MRARRTDTTHKPILDAIRDGLGWACKSLHASGDGLEDILVAVPGEPNYWVFVEAKTPRNKRGEATEGQYTKAQKEWRAWTKGWPRITAVSPEDAIAQLRRLP